MNNSGRVVLITGASTGIGRSTAIKFASEGYTVIINYLSNHIKAVEVKEKIEESNGRCDIYKADVTDSNQVYQMVNDIIKKFGQIDILINNAGGAISRSRFLECSEELWDKTLSLNLKSAFLCSKSVISNMKKRKSGKIINISSIAAKTGSPHETIHYAVAKAGLNALTKGLSREFAEDGITVNSIAPGLIETPFHQKYSTSERVNKLVELTPVKRIGKPEEVAELIYFIASDAANYITGEVITISGGR